MKLAEALVLRADRQRKVSELNNRLERIALVQEGEKPAENPASLLEELEDTLKDLTGLIKSINKTNASTQFDDSRTITDALADRDGMMLHRGVLAAFLGKAALQINRYSRSEVKFQSSVKVADIQKQIDGLSKGIRDLDTAIQANNWTVELLE